MASRYHEGVDSNSFGNCIVVDAKEENLQPEICQFLTGAPLPVSETIQKNVFGVMMQKTFDRDCDFENISAVNQALNDAVEEYGPDSSEPMELDKPTMTHILERSGADQEVIDRFSSVYDETMESLPPLSAENVANPKQAELTSAGMKIVIDSNLAQQIQSKKIDGREFVLIPVQDNLTLNGITLKATRK